MHIGFPLSHQKKLVFMLIDLNISHSLIEMLYYSVFRIKGKTVIGCQNINLWLAKT